LQLRHQPLFLPELVNINGGLVSNFGRNIAFGFISCFFVFEERSHPALRLTASASIATQ
jgi:hypothetical protein